MKTRIAKSLDALLDEASQMERQRRLPEPESFLAAPRRRIGDYGLARASWRSQWRWRSLAAAIPLLVAVTWVLLPGTGDAPNDLEVIEELDLLHSLGELSPEDLEQIDVETLEILENLDLLKSMPLELLEYSRG